MKKLALALLAIFILPASLSANGKVKADASAQEQVSEGWISWGKTHAGNGVTHVKTHKLRTAVAVALVAAAGAAVYYKDKLGCPCTSKKKA